MKRISTENLKQKKATSRVDEASWEELECSKKLLILLKQGYTLQYAGKGAFVAIKGDKRFFVRESVSKDNKSCKETAIVEKEVPNEEAK